VLDDKSLLGEHRDRVTPASRLCVGNLLVSTSGGPSVTPYHAADLVLTTHRSGRDEKSIREYIKNQEQEDQRIDQLSMFSK